MQSYPQLSIRIPPATMAAMSALCAVKQCAQWRVVVEAVDALAAPLRRSPAFRSAERQALANMAPRRPRPRRRSTAS